MLLRYEIRTSSTNVLYPCINSFYCSPQSSDPLSPRLIIASSAKTFGRSETAQMPNCPKAFARKASEAQQLSRRGRKLPNPIRNSSAFVFVQPPIIHGSFRSRDQMRQSSTKPLPQIPVDGNVLSRCGLETTTSNSH